MSFELKILVLTTTLISFSLTAIADIIVPPGFSQDRTQHPPLFPQSSIPPIQHQRASEFGPTRAELVPIYANGRQGGAAYQVGHPLLQYPHYPHYPYYPRYLHVLPRYAPQRHLRVLKIGGHKVYQPSWFVGHHTAPLAVHHRYKKSIDDRSNFGTPRKSASDSTDSSLNELNSNMKEVEDKNIGTGQSKNDHTTMRTFGGLDPTRFMNFQESKAKSSAPNARNTGVNNKPSIKESESNVEKSSSLEPKRSDSQPIESNLGTTTNDPNLGNFPDPRPDPPKHNPSHQKTSKLMNKNAPEEAMKNKEENPTLGSPWTENDIFGTKLVQQGYPTMSSIYYQHPLYVDYGSPTLGYQPFYIQRYGGCNNGISKAYDGQQSTSQQQIHQAGGIPATDFLPNTGYPFLPPTYNYVSSYILGYPQTSHYVSSPYPISYAQFN
ncbi:hypothetical protein KPH14_007554 [Odynerus spinipes]|uniref:Enamelin n=1 Tax=Odynerus spinipes TaxID=1348599 RepID=A0AAD9VM52_9HYME|nr:hypothetical protein KPH14_007554 [Odynerus spinipes]